MECKKDNLSDKSETEESQRVSVDAKCCMRYNEVIARCMAESQNRSLKENGGNNMAVSYKKLFHMMIEYGWKEKYFDL